MGSWWPGLALKGQHQVHAQRLAFALACLSQIVGSGQYGAWVNHALLAHQSDMTCIVLVLSSFLVRLHSNSLHQESFLL